VTPPPAGPGGLRLDEDYHVHSTFSDDAVSTLAENLRAARERGLATICLADHVRRDSDYLPVFLAAVASLPPVPGLRVLAGAEAKILDTTGELDLPPDSGGLDLVLIADHQFPGPDGPVLPRAVRDALGQREIRPAVVVESLVRATAAALRQARERAARASLAHLFSILPKVGLAESDVPDQLLNDLAGQARETGAQVEVNEKWACPSARTLTAFAAAGVPVVASTDSHNCADVGVYHRVPQIAARLMTPTGGR
jgi:putative hydrolase